MLFLQIVLSTSISSTKGQYREKNPGNGVPGPSTLWGHLDTLNSEAEGGNERSPVCPLGPSSRLLPRSHFPSDIWLDTFQGKGAHIGIWGLCSLGALWVPSPHPRPCVHLVFLEEGARMGEACGEVAHTPHNDLAPDT